MDGLTNDDEGQLSHFDTEHSKSISDSGLDIANDDVGIGSS